MIRLISLSVVMFLIVSCKKDPGILQSSTCFVDSIGFSYALPDSSSPIYFENDGVQYTRAVKYLGNDSVEYLPKFSSNHNLSSIQISKFGKIQLKNIFIDPVTHDLLSVGSFSELSFSYSNGDLINVLSHSYDTLTNSLYVDSIVVEYQNHQMVKVYNYNVINGISNLMTTYSNFTFLNSGITLPNKNLFIAYITGGLTYFALIRNNAATYDIEYFYDSMKGQIFNVDLATTLNPNGTVNRHSNCSYSYIGCP